jgi:hypothetical protein
MAEVFGVEAVSVEVAELLASRSEPPVPEVGTRGR